MNSRRPAQLRPPAHLSKSPPAPGPEPEPAAPAAPAAEHGGRKDGLDPTRYGDWESKGIAIDF